MSQPRPCRRVVAVLTIAVLSAVSSAAFAQALRPLASVAPGYYGDLGAEPRLSTDGTSVYFTGGPSMIAGGAYWTINGYTPGGGLTRAAVIPSGYPAPLGPMTIVGADVWFISTGQPTTIGHWSPGMTTPQYISIPSGCGVYAGSGLNVATGLMARIGADLYFETASGAQFNQGALCKLDTVTGQITKLVDFTTLVRGQVANLTVVGPFLVWNGAGTFGYPALVTYDTTSGALWATIIFGVGSGTPTATNKPWIPMEVVGNAAVFVTDEQVCLPFGCTDYFRLFSWEPVSQTFSILRDVTPAPAPDNGTWPQRVLAPTVGDLLFLPHPGQVMYHWGTTAGITPVCSGSAASGARTGVRIGDELVFYNPVVHQFWSWTFGPDPATVTMLGSGCSTSGPQPSLSFTAPVLGHLISASIANAAPGWTGYLFVSGLSPAPISIDPGCEVWLDPGSIGQLAAIYVSPAGSWSFYTGITNDAANVDLHFRLQAALIAPNASGYALTNGIEAVTGY